MTNVVMFGAKEKQKPYPKVNFVGNGESPLFFSRTNFNLFLTPEESEFVSLATLLEKSNERESMLAVPDRTVVDAMSELVLSPDCCYRCTEQMACCPLIIRSTEQRALTVEDKHLPYTWWHLRNDTEMDSWRTECAFFQSLLDLTETKAERRFLQFYLDAHMQFYAGGAVMGFGLSGELEWSGFAFFERNRDIIADILSSEPSRRVPGHRGWGRKPGGVPSTVAFIFGEEYDRSKILSAIEEDLPGSVRFLCEEFRRHGGTGFEAKIATANNLTPLEIHDLGRWLRRPLSQYPALIPQVWLRHIHDPQLGPSDPLKDEAYSRVDFVVLWNRKRVVIEIDGPEHYAEWNAAQKKWHVSEATYTRNLQRERRLKKQGWLFFRVSNQEVEEADSWNDIDHLLGFSELVQNEEWPPDYDGLFC
ncbi:MAG: hypothetical protein JSU72_19725 [Deltaproteobacteria bacterium]|nr:MAG: hypothetical protein JSU72_19725 [Deltaproteobacteria bacterium]